MSDLSYIQGEMSQKTNFLSKIPVCDTNP